MSTKPAIGLKPEWIFTYLSERDRLIEIAQAMQRYAMAGQVVPLEWCEELEARIYTFGASLGMPSMQGQA